jgi:hypothetical protein
MRPPFPCVLLALSLLAGTVSAEPVDLELALAADGSGSIDAEELQLQRDGYADAISHPAVLQAISSGQIGAIAVTYIEWGGPASQHTVVDWAVIRDAKSAEAFAQRLRETPRQAIGYNSISNALHYAAEKILTNQHEGTRKVIDLSGDGPQIGGRPLPPVRAEIVASGITINALAIKSPGGGVGGPGGMPLTEHYRRDVIGGPGAFMMVAEDRRHFREAILQKMLLEIAWALPSPARLAAAGALPPPAK